MVGNMQILDALKQIGLNLYERKLWVALLSRGTATAGELSNLAKVPHSRTYDVLESLAEKGFVIIQTSKPLKYVVVEPKEAFERAKKKIRQDRKVLTDRITNLQNSSILKELNDIHKKGVDLVAPGEMTGSLKGRDAMHQQLDTLFKKARSNIFILTTVSGLSDLDSKHIELLKKASSKGVRIRVAAPAGKDSKNVIKKLKSFAEVKRIPKKDITGRFCVIDGNHVVISLTDDETVDPTQDLAFWTKSEHVAGNMLGPMFTIMWKKLPTA